MSENKINRLVSIQQKSDKGQWVRYPVTFYDPDYPAKGAKRFFSGGAGLSSTAKDYATFLQMYLNVGTFDWGGYFNTQYFADPKEKIIGILMKQTQGPVADDTIWMFRLLAGQAVDD